MQKLSVLASGASGLLVLLVACSGGSATDPALGADGAPPEAASHTDDGGTPAQAADSGGGSPADAGDGGPSPDSGHLGDGADGGPTLAARTAAVTQTAATNALCTPLPTFYWEIGDMSGPLASGAVGHTFAADTKMNIASASKLVFGAYVVERFKDDLAMLDGSAMRMLSGYTNLTYDSCVLSKTVSDCFMAANNSTLTAANVGLFDYNGGHFQKYAVDLGLGADDSAALAADIKSVIGTEFAFTFSSPQLAGGINTSAADYAAFLRKILSGKLAIGAHLADAPVCTQPATCATSVYSPAPAAWHYSYGHWIEDDPTTGDGAFSSPGAFGFYPWIDASRTYYGIVARSSLAPQAYVQSAECGVLLRKAFMTGVAQ
jgi:hypothetical protein